MQRNLGIRHQDQREHDRHRCSNTFTRHVSSEVEASRNVTSSIALALIQVCGQADVPLGQSVRDLVLLSSTESPVVGALIQVCRDSIQQERDQSPVLDHSCVAHHPPDAKDHPREDHRCQKYENGVRKPKHDVLEPSIPLWRTHTHKASQRDRVSLNRVSQTLDTLRLDLRLGRERD